jgi:hypothetical protein
LKPQETITITTKEVSNEAIKPVVNFAQRQKAEQERIERLKKYSFLLLQSIWKLFLL